MSVEIASLLIEIDATQGERAATVLDGLTAAAKRADDATARLRAAAQQASTGHREVADSVEKVKRETEAYAQVQGQVERATRSANASAAEVRAARALEAAAMREVVAATKAYERDQASAAAAATRAAKGQAEAVAQAAELERRLLERNADLRAALIIEQDRQARAAAAAAEQLAREKAATAAAAADLEGRLLQRNADLRASLVVEQAQQARAAAAASEHAAAQEAAAWAKIEATLEKKNAQLRGSQALAGMKEEAAAVASLEARIDSLKGSIDPLYASQRRLDAEMAEATSLYKMGAISASDYAKATAVLDQRMAEAARQHDRYNSAQGRTAAASGAVARAGLNMGRQFTDIGVQIASQTPLYLVMIQQLPQIADGFAQAKMEGASFGAVMRGLFAPIAGVAASVAAFATVVGGAAIGFGLLHRELSKGYPDDITKGLGLTEDQLDRVKHKTVTMGDTFKATVDVAAKYLTQGPLGDALDWLSAAWTNTLDAMTSGMFNATAVIIGTFIGAYRSVVANWQNFPAVMKDLFVMAANAALDAIQKLVNGTVAALNAVFSVLRILPQYQWLPTIPQADLSQFKGDISGAAEFTGKAIRANIGGAIDDVRAGMRGLGKEIGAGALKNARDKALEQAGDAAKGRAAAKGPGAPRDTTQERDAQIDQLLAQARAEELQAQLDLTHDLRARADLEREILEAQTDAKQAQIDRQIASIQDDKGLSEASKTLLTMQLEAVKIAQARVGALKEQKIDDELQRQLMHDEAAIRVAGIENQVDLLESEKASAKYGFQRREIDREILAAQQEIERLKLEEIVATAESGSREREIAEARLKVLNAIHANQRKGQNGTPEDAFNDVTRALQDVVNAFEAQDWTKLVTSLVEAFGTLRDAFTRTGATMGDKLGAVAGIAGVAGQMIGGKAGGALSGAASGAMAGAAFGIPGMAIGALIGGVSGFMGASKQEKEAKKAAELAKQQAEHQRALDEANAKRQLEIALLQAQGKGVEAVKLQREAELIPLSAANQAIQLQIWALEDQAEATAKAAAIAEERADLEIRLMKATGDAAGVLTAQRAKERAGLDEANRAYYDYVVGQEDAASAVSDARDALSDAYDREAAALQSMIDKMRAADTSLRKFLQGLNTGPSAMLSPEQQYLAAKADFDRVSALPIGSDERLSSIEDVSQAYLDASKNFYASSMPYFQDLERVRAAVSATQQYAAAQVSNGEAQLSALNASVSGILGVQGAVLSVRDALAAYQAAVLAAIEAAKAPVPVTPPPVAANDNSPAIPRAPDWSSYLAHYPEVLAEYNRLSPNNLRNNLGVYSPEQFAQWHYQTYGKGEGRTPFATGGSFTVGGTGGVDSQDFGPIALSPGEIVDVRRPGDREQGSAAVVAELKAVRSELASVRKELAAANNQRGAVAKQTVKQLEGVADGLANLNRTARGQKAA